MNSNAYILGQLITLLALLVSFWGAHTANKKRHDEDVAKHDEEVARLQRIEVSVDLLMRWFETSWGVPSATIQNPAQTKQEFRNKVAGGEGSGATG